MSDKITIPSGSQVRLQYTTPGAAVIVLPPGADSVDEALMGRPGRLHATLTHDEGITWPDRTGILLANLAAEDGGFIAFQFQTEVDAEACLRRLREENRL